MPEVTLILGDAIEVMDDYNFTVDLVITDPPFSISNSRNVQNSWNGYTSKKGDWDETVDAVWVQKAYHKLKSSGLFTAFGVFGSLVPIYLELESLGATFQSHPVWSKTNPAPSIHRRMYTGANELVLVYSKGAKWTYNYDDAKMLADGKQLKNVWTSSVVKRILGRTIKHPIILQNLIIPLSDKNDTCFDPFCGTSSIGLEAIKLGRNFIGIEKDVQALELGIQQFLTLGIQPTIIEA